MNCLICAKPAERIPSIAEWKECRCLACGHYCVSEALIVALMDQGQIFDIPKARAWLKAQQADSIVPKIVSAEGLLLM